MEDTAWRTPRPSTTKIGQMRSADVSAFSATSRRDQAVRRLRRIRTAGKLPTLAGSALTLSFADAGWNCAGGFIALMAHLAA